MRGRKIALALAFSTAIHGAAITGGAVEIKHRPVRGFFGAISQKVTDYYYSRKRKSLFEEVRANMKEGRLSMGGFIIEANHIDAREAGKPFDKDKAYKSYLERLERLKRLNDRDTSVREDIYDVLKDMNYHGVPNGWMANGLLDNGGSCVQLSHLSAALLYDAGYSKMTYFRVYGADKTGTGHLTALIRDHNKKGEEVEYDITSGNAAHKAGTRFHVADLVKLYGIKHGFLPAKGGYAKVAIADEPKENPDSFIYPPASGSYPGGAPLFSLRAFGRPGSKGQKKELYCDDKIPLWVLDPIAATPDSWPKDQHHIIPFEAPRANDEYVNNLFRCIEKKKREGRKGKGTVARINHLADLAAYYRGAIWHLNLLGKHKLAKIAEREYKAADKKAKKIINGINWKCKKGIALLNKLAKNRNIHLTFLEGAGIAVLRQGPKTKTAIPIDVAGALASPNHRMYSLAMIERTPWYGWNMDVQAEVMAILHYNGVFLGTETGTKFERIFRVYQRVMDLHGWGEDYFTRRRKNITPGSPSALLRELEKALPKDKDLEKWAFWLSTQSVRMQDKGYDKVKTRFQRELSKETFFGIGLDRFETLIKAFVKERDEFWRETRKLKKEKKISGTHP
jgi:hypothetical protein